MDQVFKEILGEDFAKQIALGGKAPTDAELAARRGLLEKLSNLDWAPVVTYLEGMLPMYQAELEGLMHEARTNFLRGCIATTKIFLSLPSSIQRELDDMQKPSEEGSQDTPEGQGSAE